MIVTINDFDVFYLSYKEPHASDNYQHILQYIPHAQHVDGIHGFDTAHKYCAEQSFTERFFIIDGDNRVTPKIANLTIDVKDEIVDSVWSWSSQNYHNGLIYGNGGLKSWTRDILSNLKTHENSTKPTDNYEFCWSVNYWAMQGTPTITVVTDSDFQAWRAGYREACKLSMKRGLFCKNISDFNQISLDRLMVWMSVGQDVENGIYAILGAQMGFLDSISDKILNINNWQTMKTHFTNLNLTYEFVQHLILQNTPIIQTYIKEYTVLDKQTSLFFKKLYRDHDRPSEFIGKANEYN